MTIDAKEWRRVLKDGGVLLAVPDFDKLIRLYEQTNDINKIPPLFGQMNINSNGEDITLYHKTTYNFDSLSSLLEDNGFSNVVRYDWRNTIQRL